MAAAMQSRRGTASSRTSLFSNSRPPARGPRRPRASGRRPPPPAAGRGSASRRPASQQVARERQRLRRRARGSAPRAGRSPLEARRRHRARGEARLRGLPAGARLAGQDPVRGARLADPRGQQRGGARRKAGEADLGESDPRVVRDERRGRRPQSDLRSSAQARPRDGRERHGRRLDERRENAAHRGEHRSIAAGSGTCSATETPAENARGRPRRTISRAGGAASRIARASSASAATPRTLTGGISIERSAARRPATAGA